MFQSVVAVAAEAAVSPQRQAVPEFETTAQGCRIATSGLQCLDRMGYRDRADHAPAAREPALGRDPRDDLVGHVLAQEDWEIVRLPAIACHDETIVVDSLIGAAFFPAPARRGTASRARAAPCACTRRPR
jgi:hypothetical protein